MALTKVSGGILDPGINVAGIVTATGFDGPFTGGSTKNITAGVITATGFDLNGNGDISGNLVIGGNLTANGDFTTLNTTLREVELLRVDAGADVAAGIITQTGSGDILRLYDGSSQVVTVLDTGEVGINVSNPTDRFHVYHATENFVARFESGDTGGGIVLKDNTHVTSLLTTNGAFEINVDQGGDLSSTESLSFKTSGTEKLKVDSSGNVYFAGNRSGNDRGIIYNDANGFGIYGSSSGTNHRNIIFYSSSSGSSEKLRIKSDGSVGIGTAAPDRFVHIVDGGGGNRIMNIEGTANSGAFLAFLDVNTTDDSKVRIGTKGGNKLSLRGDEHHFESGVGTSRAFIDSNGKFGIGDFSSGSVAQALHVKGSEPKIYLEHTGGYDMTLTTSDGMGQNGITVNGGFLSLAYNNKNIVMCRTGGSVGINSTAPTAKLDIVEATSIAAVKIKSGTNTNQNASLTFSNDNGGGLMHLGVFGSGASTYGANEANDGFISAMQQLSINSQNASGEIRFGIGVPPTTKLKIDSDGHILPGASGTQNLGSTSLEWGNVYIADSGSLYIGSDQDIRIWHNSGTGNGNISNGSGNLYINATSTHEVGILVKANNSVDLYYDSSTYSTPKLSTSATGITVDGKVVASGEIETAQDYPNFRPTIDFNFAATKKLDPRITYTRTGPASYHDEFGKVVIVGDNVPRFDHTFPEYWDEGTLGDSNSRGESKGLLIEESRTNLYKNNHNLITTNDHGGITMTVNTTETTAPDGTFTATKVTASGSDQWTRWDSGNGLDLVGVNFTDTYSTSIYMKTVGTSNVNVAMDFGDSGNKTFSVGQEWKRYAISNVHQNYGGSTKFIDIVFNGNVYIWGLQLENGRFPTSYIPTTGRTQTRGTDFVKVEGEEFSEFYNDATEHTTVMVGKRLGNTVTDGRLYTISNGTSSQVAPDWDFNDDTKLRVSSNVGGSVQMVQEILSWDDDKEFKIAAGMAVNNQIGVLNGTAIAAADTSCLMPTGVDRLYFGLRGDEGNQGSLTIKRFMFYPKRLPDSQLVTLTS